MVRILHTLLRLSTALWVKSWGYLGNRSAQASATSELNLTKLISRGRAAVARKAHNLEVSGSIPLSATKKE